MVSGACIQFGAGAAVGSARVLVMTLAVLCASTIGRYADKVANLWLAVRIVYGRQKDGCCDEYRDGDVAAAVGVNDEIGNHALVELSSSVELPRKRTVVAS
jgi:hypothetical protein